jgi:hypothetical protein
MELVAKEAGLNASSIVNDELSHLCKGGGE